MIFGHAFECLLWRKEEMTILCTDTRLQFAVTNTVSADLVALYSHLIIHGD